MHVECNCVCYYNKYLLLNSRVPGHCNHEVDGILDGDNVPDQVRVDLEGSQESLAHSGDKTCNSIIVCYSVSGSVPITAEVVHDNDESDTVAIIRHK